MRNRTMLVCSLVSVAVVASACSSQSLEATTESTGTTTVTKATLDLAAEDFDDETGEPTFEVLAVENTFRPEFVEISAGTAVTFRNGGRSDHNVIPTIDDQFAAIEAANFAPGDERTITFAEPGDYPYYCSLHGTTTKGMVGAIRVI